MEQHEVLLLGVAGFMAFDLPARCSGQFISQGVGVIDLAQRLHNGA